ncbi:hypothetical protein BGW38_008123, partial [Lunasporangiospora selenospora]
MTVNRFFFQESIKLMFKLFFRVKKNIGSGSNILRTFRDEMFLQLVLRSAVHFQVQKWQQMQEQQYQGAQKPVLDSKAGSDPLQLPSNFSFKPLESVLQEYGLQLSKDLSDHDRELFSQLPSIDYSIYITSIIPEVFWKTMLPVRCNPLSNENSHLPIAAKETSDERKDRPNLRTIRGINRLLLQHNHFHITELGFHLHESAYFVPFATITPRLQILQLSGRWRISDLKNYYHNVTEFLHRHHEAFPSKERLDVHLDRAILYWEDPRGAFNSDWLKTRQEKGVGMEPVLKIYKAVGKPHTLDVTSLPSFYSDSHGIETENLVSLVDGDVNRMDAGDGPDMESFLRRSHHLKRLELSVGDPNLFRWAAPPSSLTGNSDNSLTAKLEASLSASHIYGGSPQPLPMLTNLILNGDRNARFTISALNDAVTAFGKSLEMIDVCIPIRNTLFVSGYFEDAITHTTLSLGTIPRARRVGFDWFLPNVRKIHLNLPEALEIGSFDQCPLLEELKIEGYLYHEKQPELRVSRPEWKEYFANLYMTICPQVIMDTLEDGGHLMDKDCRMNGDSNGNNGKSCSNHASSTFYPWDWELAPLTCLELQGPAAMMFHLQMLPRFSGLQSLVLSSAYPDYKLQPTMNDAVRELYAIHSLIQVQDEHLTSGGSNSTNLMEPVVQDDESPQGIVSQPSIFTVDTLDSASLPSCRFTKSQLRRLSFENFWQPIETDIWIQLLVRYAPNLEFLTVPMSLNPSPFIELLEKMDCIIQGAEAKEESLDSESGESKNEHVLKERGTDEQDKLWTPIKKRRGLKLLEVMSYEM